MSRYYTQFNAEPIQPPWLKRAAKPLSALLIGSVALGINYASKAPKAVESKEIDISVSRVASLMAGHSLSVKCQDESTLRGNDTTIGDDEYIHGYVKREDIGTKFRRIVPKKQTIFLETTDCEYIQVWTSGMLERSDMNSSDIAPFVYLAHEIEHTNGITGEAETQCNAIQKLPSELENLNFSKREAHTVAKIGSVATWYQVLPQYRSPECRPGGKYDLKVSDVYFREPTERVAGYSHDGLPQTKPDLG